MAVDVGTAYLKVLPDLAGFNAKLHEHLRTIDKPITQEVHVKVQDQAVSGLRERFKTPITQNVHVKVDETSLKQSSEKIKSHVSGLSRSVAGLAVGAVGVGSVVGGLKASVEAAANAESAHVRLAKAVSNAGLSWQNQGGAIQDWLAKTAQAKGFMEADLSNAFANMIRTTGNVTEAQTLLNDAMDISRTKGVDLASAQSLLARVYNGSFIGLKRLGIAITPVTTAQDQLRDKTAKLNKEQQHQIDLIQESNLKSDAKKKAIDKIKEATSTATTTEKEHAKALDKTATQTEALGLVQKKFGGQSSAYAKTTAGEYARFKVALEQVEVTIGTALLPELEKLALKGIKVAHDFQQHWPQIKEDITQIITPIENVGKAVFDFTKHNPDLVKSAAQFTAIAAAVHKFTGVSIGKEMLTLVGLLTGKGGARGGVVGTIKNVLTAEKPLPVIVMNPGFGGGSGGLPSFGKTASKVEGTVVKDVTTGAEVAGGAAMAGEAATAATAVEGGGMLAALGGPVGIGLAAAVIASPLIVPAVGKLIGALGGGPSHADKVGSGSASQFGKGFTQSQAGIDYTKQIAAYQKQGEQYQAQQNLPFGGAAPDAAKWGKKAEVAFKQQGGLIAKQLEAGWNQYKFQDTPTMLKQLQSQLKGLKPAAQAAAVQSAVAFAQGLEKNKRLPAGSAQSMLEVVEAEFPKLKRFIGKSAADTSKSFANNLNFNAAYKQIHGSLGSIQDDFAGTREFIKQNWKKTGDDTLEQSNLTAQYLTNVAKYGTGPMKKQAEADLKDLQAKTHLYLTAAEQTVAQNMASITGQIKSGSKQAATDAETNFGSLATNVQAAMKSGAENAKQGTKIIGDALNAMLVAFGQKPIPLAGLSAASLVKWENWWQTGNAGPATPSSHQLGHRATGGLIQIGTPGARGHDNIPMSVGGQNIVVGDGEQAMVLNAHQQGFLNNVLSPIGGIPGMFASIDRPHYMNRGGLVGYASGGGINLYGHPGNISGNLRSLIGKMEGQFPGLAVTATTDGTHVPGSYHYKGEAVDMSADSALMLQAASWVKSSGLYKSLAEGIHNPNLAVKFGKLYPGAGPFGDVWAGHLNHIHLAILGALGAIAGGTGGIPHLRNVHTPGTGTMHTIVQAMLNKGVSAANKYIDAHQPVTSGEADMQVAAGGSPGQARAWTAQAMKLAGVSGAGWMNMLLRQESRESSFNPNSVNTTDINAQRGDPSKGIMQITGSNFRTYMAAGHTNILNPVDNIIAAINYIIATYGHGNAAAALQTMIARGGGPYARGGLIKAAGGWLHPALPGRVKKILGTGKPIPRSWLHYALPPAARRAIHRAQHPHHGHHNAPPGKGQRQYWIGQNGPMPFNVTDWHGLNDKVAQIFAWDGSLSGSTGQGDTEKQSGLIDWKTNLYSSALWPTPNFSSWSSPGDFVISQDDLGHAVTPYISTHINDVVKQLGEITGYQAAWVTDLNSAKGASQALLPAITHAIKRRKTMLQNIKDKVKANVAKIKALRAQIAAENKRQRPYPNPKNKSQRDANKSFDKQRQDNLKKLNKQVADLHTENQRLVGAPDKVPAQLGGEAATISSQLGEPGSSLALGSILGDGTSASGLYQLTDSVNSWLGQLTGTGGDIDQQNLQLQTYTQGLNNLMPGANLQLQAATASSSQPVVDQFAQQLNQWFSERAGINVLQSVAPFGGSFAAGGFVPGAPGEARTIIAHGGEYIVPDKTAFGGVDVHFHGKAQELAALMDMRIEQKTRGQARGADRHRRLPGNQYR